ncbi:MAG: hypothetical protein OXB99_02775 [Acidimicrobiaceae bacterium]|nr:hypothetical protein [Acidimicrobiaceae bacterium]
MTEHTDAPQVAYALDTTVLRRLDESKQWSNSAEACAYFDVLLHPQVAQAVCKLSCAAGGTRFDETRNAQDSNWVTTSVSDHSPIMGAVS